MAAPFAALQARVNAATMRSLANAEAIIGEATVPGIFERQSLVINGGEVTGPTFLLQSNEVAAKQIRIGTTMQIPLAAQATWGSQELWGGGPFTVRGLEPDGTGMTLLILEAW